MIDEWIELAAVAAPLRGVVTAMEELVEKVLSKCHKTGQSIDTTVGCECASCRSYRAEKAEGLVSELQGVANLALAAKTALDAEKAELIKVNLQLQKTLDEAVQANKDKQLSIDNLTGDLLVAQKFGGKLTEKLAEANGLYNGLADETRALDAKVSELTKIKLAAQKAASILTELN
jgi:hypothetical protein